MSTVRRRKDAPTALKVANAAMSWTTLGLCGALPFLYSNGNWRASQETFYKLTAFSIVSPLIFWSVDLLTSPSDNVPRNLKIIRQNGYTWPRIITYNLITGWIHHAAVWFLATTSVGYELKFNWKVFATILFNWSLSEVLLTLGHKGLHEIPLLAKAHTFHHCAKWAGMMQNACFHPIDFIIELGAPVGTILFTYHCISRCKTSAILSTSLLYMWYNSDHDETLNSHHIKHHKAVNGLYTAYIPYDFGVKHELIRGLMKKNKEKYDKQRLID